VNAAKDIIIKAQFPSSEMWIRALEHASSLEAQLATRKCGRVAATVYYEVEKEVQPQMRMRQKCGFVPWNTVTHTHLWLYFFLNFIIYGRCNSRSPHPEIKMRAGPSRHLFEATPTRLPVPLLDTPIKAQFPSSEMWIRALEHGDPYAFVAVLLSQLHNIR
jgi:hypothetical protein